VVLEVPGQPVELVDDEAVDPVVLGETGASMACSWGRSAVRADSPRSTYSSASSQSRSAMKRRHASAWAGIEYPSSACSFVETRR
jgi:hypothetical protein